MGPWFCDIDCTWIVKLFLWLGSYMAVKRAAMSVRKKGQIGTSKMSIELFAKPLLNITTRTRLSKLLLKIVKKLAFLWVAENDLQNNFWLLILPVVSYLNSRKCVVFLCLGSSTVLTFSVPALQAPSQAVTILREYWTNSHKVPIKYLKDQKA